MFIISTILLGSLVSHQIHAQVLEMTDQEIVNPGFPTGIADSPGEWHSSIPVPCLEGCFTPGMVY